MRDEVRMSLRDLAFLMITVSDNAAADALLARVGLDAVNAMLDGFGLARHPGRCTSCRETAREHGRGHRARLAVPRPRLTWRGCGRSTRAAPTAARPRDMTRLLPHDLAGRGGLAARVLRGMRRLLGLQVWPHRLASGFPYDDVVVSGKTGTLPTLRNEVGVVEYPDGGRYAVAVFTRSRSRRRPAAGRRGDRHRRAARGRGAAPPLISTRPIPRIGMTANSMRLTGDREYRRKT